MNRELDQKIAIVTGAAQGIGAAIAKLNELIKAGKEEEGTPIQ